MEVWVVMHFQYDENTLQIKNVPVKVFSTEFLATQWVTAQKTLTYYVTGPFPVEVTV